MKHFKSSSRHFDDSVATVRVLHSDQSAHYSTFSDQSARYSTCFTANSEKSGIAYMVSGREISDKFHRRTFLIGN